VATADRHYASDGQRIGDTFQVGQQKMNLLVRGQRIAGSEQNHRRPERPVAAQQNPEVGVFGNKHPILIDRKLQNRGVVGIPESPLADMHGVMASPAKSFRNTV
jgi:hypothetical protein